MAYEFVEHTADIALRARGASERELFIELARGMSEYLFGGETEAGSSSCITEETVELHATDGVGLIVDWLSHILLLTSVHHGRVVVREITHISSTAVYAKLAVVQGEQLEDIKAVTYHGLKVVHTPDGVEACVTFDI